jgi:hypothetical protein
LPLVAYGLQRNATNATATDVSLTTGIIPPLPIANQFEAGTKYQLQIGAINFLHGNKSIGKLAKDQTFKHTSRSSLLDLERNDATNAQTKVSTKTAPTKKPMKSQDDTISSNNSLLTSFFRKKVF